MQKTTLKTYPGKTGLKRWSRAAAGGQPVKFTRPQPDWIAWGKEAVRLLGGEIEAAEIARERRGKRSTAKHKYLDITIAFDIETTRLREIDESIMYIWMLQAGENIPTIVGRTWEEFSALLWRMSLIAKSRGAYICIWVHNLSYEFQFLRTVYDFSPAEVFAVKSRKVLKLDFSELMIEMRCSYIHSNMSLKEFADKMGAEYRKQSGDLDYGKLRFPWSELTNREMGYCVGDVKSLVSALNIEMKHDGDTIATIPITSTGYIRRDIRKALYASRFPYYRVTLTPELYALMREAFRGGDTHASRRRAGLLLSDVHSFDRSSSYPGVMCHKMFPVTRFEPVSNLCGSPEVLENLIRHGKAVICRVALKNPCIKQDVVCPYIPTAKCRNILKYRSDNGRVLRADYLEISITDIDWEIIKNQYTWNDAYVFDIYTADYGPLPKAIIKVLCDLFTAKTELKGVEGQEVYYMKSKNKINSVYGLSAQDPVKDSIIFNGIDFEVDEANTEETLEKRNRKAAMPYQWGVWVTAWARYELHRLINLLGKEFVYCDTDSVKFTGEIPWEEINAINKDYIRISEKIGSNAVDRKGNKHYMEVWEYEGTYRKFKTYGAKKYAYISDSGILSVTVAGVSKQSGADELQDIKNFSPGFRFRLAGGSELRYKDDIGLRWHKVQNHLLYIGPNVSIVDSEYTLGLTHEYAELIFNGDKIWIGY